MGQLEPQLRAVLRGRIKHYLREHNCTTILVTHDQTEANALADRIAVMEGGVLQQYATPAELKAPPGQSFHRHIHRRAADERVQCQRSRPMRKTVELRHRWRRAPRLSGGGIFRRLCDSFCRSSKRVAHRHPAACAACRARARSGARSCPASGSATRPMWPSKSAGRTVVSVAHERVSQKTRQRDRLECRGRTICISSMPASGKAIAHGGDARMKRWRAHRHRCRHVGHQVGRLHHRRRTDCRPRPSPMSTRRLPMAASSRTWRAPGATRPRPCGSLREKIPNLADRVHRHLGDGPGRRHVADRQGRASPWRLPGCGSMRAPLRSPRSLPATPDYAAHYKRTGTGVNACQMSMQLAWMARHRPEVLARAATLPSTARIGSTSS